MGTDSDDEPQEDIEPWGEETIPSNDAKNPTFVLPAGIAELRACKNCGFFISIFETKICPLCKYPYQ